MKFTLRPYQQRASDAAVEFFLDESKKYNGLIVASTGAGKSVIIADIANRLNSDVLCFCPSKELTEQNYEKMLTYTKKCSMYSASVGMKKISKVTFATIGSVKNSKELFSHFKFVLIDECHCVNPQEGMYADFLKEIPCKVIGLTATPFRLESEVKMDWRTKTVESCESKLVPIVGRKDSIFKEVLCNIPIRELLEGGYLAKLKYFDVPPPRYKQMKMFENTSGTDYSDKSIKYVQEKTNFKDWAVSIVRRLKNPKDGKRRKGIIVFVRFIEDAEYIQRNVNSSAIVTAKTKKKDRTDIIERFKKGELEVLINVSALSKGFDYPQLDTVVLARPTKSLALLQQMIGRGMRIHKDKKDAWIVDLCGNIDRFGHVEESEFKEVNGEWNVFCKGEMVTNVIL